MALSSRFISFFVFGIILLAAVLITLNTAPGNYDNSRARVFMTVLAGLGVIIVFFFYYGVTELNARQQRLSVIQETARLSNILVEELMLEIADSAKIIPNFASSLTPIQTNFQNIPDSQTPEAIFSKVFLSYKIFAVWQDVLIADEFTANEPLSYITSFLQRANSQSLYYEWIKSKIDFNQITQEFGDLLFEYALPIHDQQPQVYVDLAKQLLKDRRYLKIMSH